MARNYPADTPVILTDTWQHGVVTVQNPNGKYNIRVTGRPARAAQPDKRGRGVILARGQSPDFDRDQVEEEVIAPRPNAAAMDVANHLIRMTDVRGVRQTADEKDELRVFSEDIVDEDASTDHQIDEAQRHLDALDQVAIEDA